MNERLALEEAACRYFLASYNGIHSTSFEVCEHRDSPDFVASDSRSGERIGIEVTHLFYDGREAKMLLGRLPKQTHGVMTIDGLIERLNKLLVQKIAKACRYQFSGQLFLVVRVASPIFDRQDFDMCEDDISFPTGNNFTEIWLLFWDQASQAYTDIKQLQ